ncbi:MAG TPA: serine hydrolase domain-containing protein [Candidatus Limnocylindrales bacterium]
MPKQPPEHDRTTRTPHARPAQPARGRSGGSRRAGTSGVLRSRAGIGIAAVAAIAALIAVTGVFATPTRSPDSVAAAGATTIPVSRPAATPALGAVGSSSPEPTSDATAHPPASPTPAPSEPLAGVPSDRLQKALDAFRKKTGIPGISVAIVWDDGRAWAGATGRADVADDVPMTTGTAFAFASISKTFTAAVVLQLVDEGKVKLDQPAADYLPAYPLDRRITVRMLMDHRSSLPDFFANAKIDKALRADKGATWTAQRTWTFVPRFRPTPGTIYDYSNTNYLLLGELVENVTGNPLSTEVRDRLLDPLQLNTAWYQVAEKPRAPGATGYRLTRTASGAVVTPVAGHSSVMPFRSVVSAAGGAGSIAGTATDAARWMQAYGSGSLLSPRTYAAMIADSKYTAAMHAIVTYGLGVQVITIEHQKTLGHSGRYVGFQNTVRYLRGPGISIAILTNQNTYDPAVLMRRLIRIVAPVK